MIVEELFETKFFPELKKYVEQKSIYGPQVTKAKPQESKVFPIVPVKLLPTRNKYNNLSYGEETYTFGIDINVYAMAKEDKSKRTVCNEITSHIVDYFKTNYHVTIRIELDAPNVDSSVHRNIIRITGKLDTKYGFDKLVIYPN